MFEMDAIFKIVIYVSSHKDRLMQLNKVNPTGYTTMGVTHAQVEASFNHYLCSRLHDSPSLFFSPMGD